MSSGPAPRASESTNCGTDSSSANGGAARPRCGENNNGELGDSGKTESSVSAAGHTHDKGYSKWAKFDVDAALRSVEEEGGAGTEQKVWDEA